MIHKSDFAFNSDRDVKAVQPDGWLDIKSAFVNGVVPGNLEIEDTEGNGIEDPLNVGENPRDTFKALRLVKQASKTATADTSQEAAQ